MFPQVRHGVGEAQRRRSIDRVDAAGDYGSLFYALLMKKRVELGVSPFPTGPSADLPPHTHEPYEDAGTDEWIDPRTPEFGQVRGALSKI